MVTHFVFLGHEKIKMYFSINGYVKTQKTKSSVWYYRADVNFESDAYVNVKVYVKVEVSLTIDLLYNMLVLKQSLNNQTIKITPSTTEELAANKLHVNIQHVLVLSVYSLYPSSESKDPFQVWGGQDVSAHH